MISGADVINDVQDELSTKLTPLIVGGALPGKALYGYRTLPGDLRTEVGITYMGGRSGDGVTGEEGYTLLYSLFMFTQHTNAASSLATAERILNEIESIVIAALDDEDRTLLYRGANYDWLEYVGSQRPPSPRDVPNTRHGLIFLRAHI